MFDPVTTGAFVAAWGPYGAIVVILLAVCAWLGKSLLSSYQERLADTKAQLTEQLQSKAELTQALRDMKSTVDAVLMLIKTRAP